MDTVMASHGHARLPSCHARQRPGICRPVTPNAAAESSGRAAGNYFSAGLPKNQFPLRCPPPLVTLNGVKGPPHGQGTKSAFCVDVLFPQQAICSFRERQTPLGGRFCSLAVRKSGWNPRLTASNMQLSESSSNLPSLRGSCCY